MSENLRVNIRDACSQIKAGKSMFEEGLKALSNALDALGYCEDFLLQHGLDNLPECDLPVTEHRRLHRKGTVPKIDSDPELRAFVLAHIDRMTYAQVANAVAGYFPEPRRVSRTAICVWAKRQRKR